MALGLDDGLLLGESDGVSVGLGLGTGESVGLYVGVFVGTGVPVGDSVGAMEGLGLGTGESVGEAVGEVGAADSLGAAEGGMSISNVLIPKPVSLSCPKDGPTRRAPITTILNLILLFVGNQSNSIRGARQ